MTGRPDRLDRAMVERGLAESRSKAAVMITDGEVRVNGEVRRRASQPVTTSDRISVVDRPRRVSRAADKLEGALDDLGLAVSGIALDAGASTGGFTEILLERGCDRVYAVDVGHGQLHPRIAADPRVVSRERLNLRDLTSAHLDGHAADVVVADVSFISLTLVLPPVLAVAAPGATVLVMVKPQFEVGRAGLDSHGVVTDPARREAAIAAVVETAEACGRRCAARVPSRLPGESGNLEEFLHLVPATSADARPTALGD